MTDTGIAAFAGDPKIRERIYDDLFSPALSNAGVALGNIFYLATTVTVPLALLGRGANIWLENSLKKYEEKIKEIPESDRVEVRPDIGVPILENLSHTSDEKIGDLFIKLLEKGTNKQTASLVHPKYIKIIETLSHDDAVVVNYLIKYLLNKGQNLACIQIRKKTMGGFEILIDKFCGSEILESMENPEQLSLTLDNLISLGLISIDFSTSFVKESLYDSLISDKSIEEFTSNSEVYEIKKGILSITNLGASFISTIW
ncbi:DUF4393 domain-containing protein [Candidatus Gracilibacteria bacterium]|nr:DUF4393 domain-containing protein [Candidatus Gracilibacteria bacterium]